MDTEHLLQEYPTATTDRMLHIAREVAGRGPDAVASFARLLTVDDPRVKRQAAHHLLDFMEPSEASRERALAIIEQAAGDAVDERLWLESFRAEQQNE